MVDCFTGCTDEYVKDTILQQFSTPSSCLRVLIATIAFVLGPDISIPEDIETYVQQVGRAGHDGKLSYCTITKDIPTVTF